MVDESIGIIVGDPKDIFLFISWYYLVLVLGIQVLQFVHRHSDEFRNLFEVQHLVDFECIYMHRHFYGLWHYAVFLVVGHGVQGPHESRHIASGLSRKIRIYVPESPFSSASADGPVYIPCPAVIGRYGQIPVSENVVRILHVLCCGMGRFHRIQPFVNERIDVKPVYLGRAVHELPHTLGSGPGNGGRVHCRLYHRHGLEFERNVMLVEYLFDYRHVIRAKAQHLTHPLVHLLRIQDNIVPDNIVVRQVNEGVHRLYPFNIYGIRNVGREFYRIHVIFAIPCLADFLLQVPDVQQAVGHFRIIVLGIEPCGAFVFILVVNVHDFQTETVHLVHFITDSGKFGLQ